LKSGGVERERERERGIGITSHIWEGFTKFRRRRERETKRDGKVLPHRSERVLLKTGSVEKERDGKVLPHISERVLLKSGGVERERERVTEKYYLT
jgi:hypothetical protein